MRPQQDKQDKIRAVKAERFNRLKKDYKDIFQSAAGHRVLDDLLSKAQIWETTFTGNSKTYFNEGRRDLGLYIFKMVNAADPNIIAQFIFDNAKLKASKEDG